MTHLVQLSLAISAIVCLLVCVLSAVYIWSGNTGRRNRAWRVLDALLRAVGRPAGPEGR
ncbi:hypothetical protein [Streptomyces sp. NPDC046853]|uniref:hypothetical protein n=1 Tax=unclassified Streptomyces TaxID=2593676 RepID=UPI0033D02D53